MKTLKSMIRRYMCLIAVIIVIGVLIITVITDVLGEQRHEKQLAQRMFYQIEHVLEDNEKDLKEIVWTYAHQCLDNAKMIAYILENSKEEINDIETLRKIASLAGVDEIHLFDKTGMIYAGTEEDCIGITFDDGEQIGYFKPMLEDKSLEMCQEITPNTVRNRPMQYSAVWSESGEFIVQVGMKPNAIIEVTEKNELSHIFSMLRVNVGASFYAINIETGKIVASTNSFDKGLRAADIGFPKDISKSETHDFHAIIHNVPSFCVFTVIGENYIGRVVSNEMLYEEVPMNTVEMAFGLIVIALILVGAVTKYMNYHVVNDIHEVNDKLESITNGNLEERVDVRENIEFSELSDHVNEMVVSLVDKNEQLSYLLQKIEMERDYDVLTGLYNRRGLDSKLACLFNDPEKLQFCAMIMIDSDGLKEINDQYGHEVGDVYLKETGRQFFKLGTQKSIIARQGGDEFVLFLYEYSDEEELVQVIKELEYLQSHTYVDLGNQVMVQIKFSFGYEIKKEPTNYRELLKCADEKMYQNKKMRKSR